MLIQHYFNYLCGQYAVFYTVYEVFVFLMCIIHFQLIHINTHKLLNINFIITFLRLLQIKNVCSMYVNITAI
jgi:hypothetical protein